MLSEIWKPVEDYPYEVSNLGNVRRVWRPSKRHPFGRTKPVNPCRAKSGARYFIVSLASPGRTKREYLHTLVCTAFHGPRPDGMIVRHWNGDTANNRADNLLWGTHVENVHDKLRHGKDNRGERHALVKLTADQVVEIRKSRELRKVLAQRFNVSIHTISAIRYRKIWKWVE